MLALSVKQVLRIWSDSFASLWGLQWVKINQQVQSSFTIHITMIRGAMESSPFQISLHILKAIFKDGFLLYFKSEIVWRKFS